MSGVHERDRDPLGRRIRARLGRRGASLLFFAFLDLAFALIMATTTDPSTSAGYAFLSRIAPLWVWAVPWAVVGLLCLAYSIAEHDRPAFIAVSALKVGWGVLYLAGWLWGEIDRGYVAAVIWGAFAGFVQVIAGWAERPRPREET
jgi:hypothetical protein